ncbi:tyrosine-type recombinase/integrase [Clostridium sp.]|uniref:site-specific integrase n=1 Tax=Clostridium sp. TaxID=1506 RepID=UPI00290F3EAD|nr:tyrosine-type recombinase/integrase [Clostridium sp.]MDU7212966.1 tyrosine-type recombinase/integrase [Clostridium sp.]
MDYNITYRQKDKGWQFIISYKDENGKWKQKSKQGFKTKKEAKPVAEKVVQDLKANKNLNQELKELTFEEFKDIYLEHLKLHMQENTIRLYKMAFQYLKPIYNLELVKITPLHLQRCIDDMIRNGLAYGTIKTYKNRITAIFNSAVDKYNIIPSSPANKLEIKVCKEPSKKKALTKNELDDLINKTKNMKYKVIFSLAGMCGLRIGEILGLRWSRIDFNKNTITIDIQWKNLNGNTVGFGELKSANSYRVVPLPPSVKKLLIEWKNHNSIDISNRVIVYKCISGLTALLRNYTKKLGYDLSIHEFRHTYATTLISRGVDFKTVAKLMGHDVEQTMKTYSHVTDEMMDNATQLINKIF